MNLLYNIFYLSERAVSEKYIYKSYIDIYSTRITYILEVTIARELLPYDLHLDHINYLLITKGPTDANIVQILHLSNSFESKHWFTSTANKLNSVRYSVDTSYFTKHKSSKYIQIHHDVMYSGEYDVCVATLSVYPHRASIPKVVGSNPTVARYIFQACPAWIYTQSSNTYIIYKAFVHIKDFFTPVLLDQNRE